MDSKAKITQSSELLLDSTILKMPNKYLRTDFFKPIKFDPAHIDCKISGANTQLSRFLHVPLSLSSCRFLLAFSRSLSF